MNSSDTRPRQQLNLAATVGAILAMSFGLAAILGWMTGTMTLASLGKDRIPMAPSTALLFGLYGAAILLRIYKPEHKGANRAGVYLVSASSLIALSLLTLSSFGITAKVEHLGFRITGTGTAFPLGHMSPLTAVCFLMTGGAALLSAPIFARQSRRLIAALALTGLLTISSVVLTIAYILGEPLLYGSTNIPPVLTTSLAFMALGISLLSMILPQIRSSPERLPPVEKKPLMASTLILAFICLDAITAAYVYFQDYQTRFRAQVESELSAVAELKIMELTRWREERQKDAGIYAALMPRYLEKPGDEEARARRLAWLTKIQTEYHYESVFLLDAHGAVVASAPESDTLIDATIAEQARKVIEQGTIAFVDFYRGEPGQRVYLAVLAPIFDEDNSGTPLGVLALQINPDDYLYPLLQRWPTARTTAETLLVRRDGDDALFLNDLKFQDNAALRLRVPLANADLPAAMAILGKEGVVEGIDYRGVKVAATVKAIPASPWFLVARMDTDEIYAPLRERLWWLAGFVGLLLLGSGTAAGWLWQRNTKTHYRALYHAEAQYGITLRSIGDGVIATDDAGRVELLNPVAAELTGWRQQEAVGRPLGDIFHIINEETRQNVENPVTRVLREKHVVGLANHTLLINRNGVEIPIADSGAPIYDTQGEITGVVLIFRDQTEERAIQQRLLEEIARSQRYLAESRLAEASLRQSRDALNRAQAVAHVGSWSWHVQDNRLEWSDEMYSIFGIDRESFTGHLPDVISSAIHPDDRAAVEASNLAVAQEKRPIPLEYRVIRPDGTTRTVWGEAGALILDDAGNPAVLTGIVQDITERVQAESDRRKLLAQIETQAVQISRMIDAVPQGVILLDADGSIMLANPTAKAYLTDLGYPGSGGLTHLGSHPLQELLTSPPKGLWHEVQIATRTFELIARPIEDSSHPQRWVLVIHDATQERHVREQLRQQERLAAIGQLAAGIAHDFNNIMAIIVLHAQLTEQSPRLSDHDRKRLATINQQAHYATQLIQQILDFSRRAVLEKQPLDLLPVIKEQVKLLKRTLPEHIAIRLSGTNDTYMTSADPTRIQQVVMNLAVNARDAMPNGGELRFVLDHATTTLDAPPPILGMPPGNWISLTIEDTGTGIMPEVLPHIFEPFFTTKAPGQGSGLGLPQVHGIVAQHDGYIDVRTEVGQGTSFVIYLPAQQKEITFPPTRELHALLRGNGEVILVVEDNAPLREALREMFAGLGYKVLEAPHGVEALATLGNTTVDLILSDVVMPQMGGVALVYALRDQGYTMPVILMSGHPRQSELGELRAHGVYEWLPKPPDLDQLTKAVADALKA